MTRKWFFVVVKHPFGTVMKVKGLPLVFMHRHDATKESKRINKKTPGLTSVECWPLPQIKPSQAN
jgi:hypothetical protein